MRMHLAETLIVFLLGIAFSSAPVTGNNIITARLDDSIDTEIRKGFVELSVDRVNWYKLCDNGRSSSPYFKVASIVCQQLGYGPPVLAEGHIETSYDNEYFQFEDEWCNVTTTQVLQECSLEGSFASVPDSCYGRIMYVECLPAEANEYDVALVVDDSFGSFEGLVLIHVNGQWGPICSGSAGDAVCHQLGYGSAYSGIFHGDVSSDTYASPVLDYLYCYSYEETIEECTKNSEIVGTCDPDMYLKVSCKESDYSDEDDRGGGFRPSGISPSYFLFLVVIIMSMGILFRVYAVKARARQRQQNPVGATGVQALSTTVNQRSDPSRFATANYPRQQTQPFTFQGYQPSGMQEAASVPPYPPSYIYPMQPSPFQVYQPSGMQPADSAPPYTAASYQSPPAPYPPQPNDTELPSYDDAVKSQTPTA